MAEAHGLPIFEVAGLSKISSETPPPSSVDLNVQPAGVHASGGSGVFKTLANLHSVRDVRHLRAPGHVAAACPASGQSADRKPTSGRKSNPKATQGASLLRLHNLQIHNRHQADRPPTRTSRCRGE